MLYDQRVTLNALPLYSINKPNLKDYLPFTIITLHHRQSLCFRTKVPFSRGRFGKENKKDEPEAAYDSVLWAGLCEQQHLLCLLLAV